MKKIICSVVIALLIASVAFAQKKMSITPKDLAALKGTYEGRMAFGDITESESSHATLEILNDTVPVKVKLTIADVSVRIASLFGITSGKNVFESDDGTITTMGTIMWTGQAKNFFEVSQTGEKTLKAWYYFKGVRGDATFKRK